MKRDEFKTGLDGIFKRMFMGGLAFGNAKTEIMELFDLHEQQELNKSLLEKMSEEAGYTLEYDPVSKQIVRAEEKE